MNTIVSQASKYILLALMVLFTIETYMVLRRRDEKSRNRIMRKQIGLMVMFNLVAYPTMYLLSGDFQMLVMFLSVVCFILVVQVLYRLIYRRASMILLNTMCMMLSVGFVIQSRLGMETAMKQFIITSLATLICFIIPVFIRKVRIVSRLTWLYAVAGIGLLGVVLLFGRITGGAQLSVSLGGITFQFSEFVKITVVLFMAGMLQNRHDFKTVLAVTVVAAVHVGILALSADLGAALIYFMAYIVMVFVATRNPGYAFLGLGGMAGASIVAYRLFDHVRVRVAVWKDPFQDYEGTGYQIVQALFGVCAGGWFGTGLFKGNPDMIPLAYEDFTFAAICEEFGVLFAICLILLCMGMYLLIVNIATKLEKPFYRLVAVGLGTEYAFQVFLTVGGTTKFIPMTGITLPLISYGGSSIMCTIIMISIIQGLYIMRTDESQAREEERMQQRLRRRISNQEQYLREYQRPERRSGYSGQGEGGSGQNVRYGESSRNGGGDVRTGYADGGTTKIIRKLNRSQNRLDSADEMERKNGQEIGDTDELAKKIEEQTKNGLEIHY